MAELTPPEQMRVMLVAMRNDGWSFARAWPNAIQRIRVQPYMTPEEVDDLLDWKRWLEWAKPAFHAAFYLEPNPALDQLGAPEIGASLAAATADLAVHH